MYSLRKHLHFLYFWATCLASCLKSAHKMAKGALQISVNTFAIFLWQKLLTTFIFIQTSHSSSITHFYLDHYQLHSFYLGSAQTNDKKTPSPNLCVTYSHSPWKSSCKSKMQRRKKEEILDIELDILSKYKKKNNIQHIYIILTHYKFRLFVPVRILSIPIFKKHLNHCSTLYSRATRRP